MVREAHAIENDNPKVIYNIACIYFSLNKMDDGLNQLLRAFTFENQLILSQMVKDPEISHLKKNPKFAEFLKDVRAEVVSK